MAPHCRKDHAGDPTAIDEQAEAAARQEVLIHEGEGIGAEGFVEERQSPHCSTDQGHVHTGISERKQKCRPDLARRVHLDEHAGECQDRQRNLSVGGVSGARGSSSIARNEGRGGGDLTHVASYAKQTSVAGTSARHRALCHSFTAVRSALGQ